MAADARGAGFSGNSYAAASTYFARGQPAAAASQVRRQGLALHVVVHQVGPAASVRRMAGLVQRHDMRVRQVADGAGLLQLLLRPCEVSSRIAHAAVLEVAHHALRIVLQARHVLVGSVA